MNVVHIFHSLKFSGAEIMYTDAAKYFKEYGCNLSVIATAEELGEFSERFEKVGYEVYHYPFLRKNNLIEKIKYLIKIIKFLKTNNIDVVHIHSNGLYFEYSLCAYIARIKSVYTFHSVFPTKKITKLYHIAKRWIAKNIFKCTFQTISDSVYNNELSTFKNKTTKIDNWYSDDRYFPAIENEKTEIRKELDIDKDSFVIISIGGCSHIKRHDEIIKALELVIKEIPNILYLHLGEGIEENNEKELTNALNLKEHIRFLGNQQNVRKYLIASDLYIMTSKFEGISITTIEAMASNISTILYNVPGLRDFNKESENALLIDENYKILAEYLINIYNQKIDLTTLANNAKRFVDSKYNMRKNSEKIYSLYTK